MNLDYGAWEGLTKEEAAQVDSEAWANYLADPERAVCPEGEAVCEAADRVIAALRAIARQHPGESVAAVSHGVMLRLAVLRVAGASDSDWQFAIPTGSAHRLRRGRRRDQDRVGSRPHQIRSAQVVGRARDADRARRLIAAAPRADLVDPSLLPHVRGPEYDAVWLELTAFAGLDLTLSAVMVDCSHREAWGRCDVGSNESVGVCGRDGGCRRAGYGGNGAGGPVGVHPVPTWQANGRVNAIVVSGSTVYLGGQFTSMRPPATPPAPVRWPATTWPRST